MQEINDKTILWDEKIDRFLSKSMTPAEEDEFIRQIQADPQLKTYVASTTLLIKALREQGQRDADNFHDAAMHTAPRDFYFAIGKKMPRPLLVRFSPLLAVAACACAFFGNSYMLKTTTLDFAQHSGITPDIITRGDDTSRLQSLFANVDSGTDLPATIPELEKALRSLPQEDSTEYRTIAWYLALAHIKNGDNEQAQAVLQQILKVAPDFQQAWQLRDKLARTFFWQ